jgi:hypothetical protein
MTLIIIVISLIAAVAVYSESCDKKYPRYPSYILLTIIIALQFALYVHVGNLEDEAYQDGLKQANKEAVHSAIEEFKKHHVCIKDSGDQLIELLRSK